MVCALTSDQRHRRCPPARERAEEAEQNGYPDGAPQPARLPLEALERGAEGRRQRSVVYWREVDELRNVILDGVVVAHESQRSNVRTKRNARDCGTRMPCSAVATERRLVATVSQTALKPGTITSAMFRVETIEDAGGAVPSEDRIVRGIDVFAVCDGMSSVGPPGVQGASGGARAADLAAACLVESSGASLETVLAVANARLAEEMQSAGVGWADPLARWGTMIAAVRLAPPWLEWVGVGDCGLLLHLADDTLRLEIERDHDEGALALLRARAAGTPVTDEVVSAELRRNRLVANETYGALNGDPRVRGFIRGGAVPLADLRHVLLFTDGLWPADLRADLQDDVAEFFATFLAGGLGAIRIRTRGLEAADPHCRRFVRLKPHDDLAGVALTFGEPSAVE